MNQTILFLRGAQVYASKEAAIAGIAGVEHKAGQPVVAFYEVAGEQAGDPKVTKLAFAIGNGDGVGKYNLLATSADYDELLSLFELHLENFDTHIKKAANGTLGHVKNGDYITFDADGAGELVDNSVSLEKLQKVAAKGILGNAGDEEDTVAVLTAEEVFGIIAVEVANNFKTVVNSSNNNNITITTKIGEKDLPGFSLIAGDNVTFSTNGDDAALGTSITISVDPTNFSVDKAQEAAKLSESKNFEITGDDYIKGTEAPVAFDGTEDVSLAISLNKEVLAAAIFESAALTGTPTAPTAETATDNTQVATTEFVHNVIETLDAEEVKVEGKAIVAISQADGIISATAGSINAEFVDIKDENEYFTATTVEGALAELYSQAGAGSKVTMISSNVEEEDEDGNKVVTAKAYKFYQGGEEEANLIGTINIAKDLVVNKGELVEKDGEQYIVLELNDKDKTQIEVKVTDLVDTYTGKDSISVSDNNEIVLTTSNSFTQDNGILDIKLGTGLSRVLSGDRKGELLINQGAGLVLDENGALTIRTGKGTVLDTDNTLKTNIDEEYLVFDEDGVITLDKDFVDSVDDWKGISVNGKSFSVEDPNNITVGAGDIAYGEDSNIKDALDTLNSDLGKVKVSEEATSLQYLGDVLKMGTAIADQNIYGVSVDSEAAFSYFTVKIDTIDGGTF